jgi:hypothetical protein
MSNTDLETEIKKIAQLDLTDKRPKKVLLKRTGLFKLK